MKKLFIFLFLFTTTLFAKVDIDVNAKNAVLINAENGRVLFEKSAYDKAYPASTTKIATGIYILEKFSDKLNNEYVATSDALKVVSPEKKQSSTFLPMYVLESDGASFDIQEKERLTLKDLLYGIMMCSGNDAANVAAKCVFGDIDQFMKNVNQYLKKIGLENTNFLNPHGLHVNDHYTTAYDLALLTSYAIKNPLFLDFFSSKYYLRPKTNKQPSKEKITYNKLFKPGKYYYSYATGSKTGYEHKAKYCLVSAAKKNDRTLIAVVLGCKNNDVRYEDTIKLFETVFNENKITKKIIDKETIYLTKFEGAANSSKVQLKEDLLISYFPSEEVPIKAFLVFDDLKAPIKKGQKIGYVVVKAQDGEILKKQALFSLDNCRRSFLYILKNIF
ncbi:MAG: D-alanyl-D-alanine carboxypeptidase [Parachlamydiales bacterium]|nr:D-alanyl-D-alanine carboxypeptidase [Parachlamydiales bacterium]